MKPKYRIEIYHIGLSGVVRFVITRRFMRFFWSDITLGTLTKAEAEKTLAELNAI